DCGSQSHLSDHCAWQQISRSMTARSTAAVKGTLATSLLHLSDQKLAMRVGRSRSCRFCCESPEFGGGNFSPIRRSERRAAIFMASVALARSVTSLSSGDEVPHMFTRTSRL